jgi:hypothetical protein
MSSCYTVNCTTMTAAFCSRVKIGPVRNDSHAHRASGRLFNLLGVGKLSTVFCNNEVNESGTF